LAFCFGKNGKNSANSRKNVNNKKSCKKFEITNLKEKRLLLMNKNLKVFVIIPTLNT
jgi:hypothetical protein